MEKSNIPLPKPEPVKGAAHVLAATKYSIGGIRRLRKETAFTLILIALPICLSVLAS